MFKSKKTIKKYSFKVLLKPGFFALFFIFFFLGIDGVKALDICTGTSEYCLYLKEKETQGLAAGNDGDYYANCDSGHANLNISSWPRVQALPQTFGYSRITYPDQVVVGNASVAYIYSTPVHSVVRNSFMRYSSAADLAYRQYRDNDMFWYPEHVDHDAVDWYHGMTAAVNNSQGSSTSELDELQKIFWTLAAFRPATKEKLKQNGLLMPAIQMIMRRTRVASDAEYLSGKAHWNAFDNFENTRAMMEMANGILPENIPPMVQLEMISDDYNENVDWNFKDNRIYDSLVSISRIWGGLGYRKHMRISAAGSFDANSKELTYHWKVLRGDPSHVRITPRNANGSEVDVELDYHGEVQIPNSPTSRTSNLAVIGCFVNNGAYYSAPGFVTSYTLPFEKRVYDENKGTLQEISYISRSPISYIGYDKSWAKDTFRFNWSGELQGWWREPSSPIRSFTPEGYLITKRDSSGKVTEAQNVSYSVDYSAGGTGKAVWTATGEPFAYTGNAVMPDSPDTNYAAGDLNLDNNVNQTDFDILKTDFLKFTGSLTNPRSDINADGQCTVKDVGILMSGWR